MLVEIGTAPCKSRGALLDWRWMSDGQPDWSRDDEKTSVSEAAGDLAAADPGPAFDALVEEARAAVRAYQDALAEAASRPSDVACARLEPPSEVATRNALASIGAWVLARLDAGDTDGVLAAVGAYESAMREASPSEEAASEGASNEGAGALPPPPIDAFDEETPSPSGLFQTIERKTPNDYVGPRDSLSDEQIQMLRSSMGPTLTSPTEQRLRRRERARSELRAWADALGATPTQLGKHSASAEVGRLHEVVSARLAEWEELPREYNHMLTSWVTKRLRAAQEVVSTRQPKMAEELEHIEQGIRRLSRHSKISQPGFVYGLGLDHKPELGSWVEDALHEEQRIRSELGEALDDLALETTLNIDDALRTLTDEVRQGLADAALRERVARLLDEGVPAEHVRFVRLLAPYEETFADDERFGRLRRALRAERESNERQADADVSPLPAAWPGWPYTEGRSAVIVGGEPRAQRVDALRRVFRFGELEWIANSDKGTRRVQALTNRIKQGSVDLVICLRAFSSHKLYDAVFDVDAPRCDRVLADTYGVTQIRLAIERDLGLEGPETLQAG